MYLPEREGMFWFILISIFTLVQAYVFWRTSSVPLVVGHRQLLAGVGVVLWLLFIAGVVYGHRGMGLAARWLEVAALHWMAVLFLLFVCLLAADIVTGFGLFIPRFAPALRGAAVIAAVLLTIFALVQGFRPPVVQRYEVRLPGLSPALDGTVIVSMCDLHLGALLGGKWMSRRVAQVQAQRPDIVFLVGDIYDGHGRSIDELIPSMRGLSAPLGVWAVTGNHEFYGGLNAFTQLMERSGIHLLRDQWSEATPGLVVAGVDDLTTRRRQGIIGEQISKTLKGRPSGATILLSHTPWRMEEAAKEGVGLMLSGHTHGGQIWPFGYLVRLFYPLLEGRHIVSGMTIIVSRGTGTWGSRMRLWRRGEILRITLRSDYYLRP